MKIDHGCKTSAAGPVWLVLMALLISFYGAAAAVEEQFEVLQVGTHTYTNVTVTTKARSYVFVLHSAGMANIKVSDLPTEIRRKLGYFTEAEKAKAQTSSAANWAKTELTRIEPPQVKQARVELVQKYSGYTQEDARRLVQAHSRLILGILVASLAVYLFFCNCCRLICKKTGHEPGILVWLPVLQIFPLLRAAGMSPLWFLAFLIGFLSPLAVIVLSFKLAKARGKSAWVGFFLLLPVISIFAFLYLAFSDAKPVKEQRNLELMNFEAA